MTKGFTPNKTPLWFAVTALFCCCAANFYWLTILPNIFASSFYLHMNVTERNGRSLDNRGVMKRVVHIFYRENYGQKGISL